MSEKREIMDLANSYIATTKHTSESMERVIVEDNFDWIWMEVLMERGRYYTIKMRKDDAFKLASLITQFSCIEKPADENEAQP